MRWHTLWLHRGTGSALTCLSNVGNRYSLTCSFFHESNYTAALFMRLNLFTFSGPEVQLGLDPIVGIVLGVSAAIAIIFTIVALFIPCIFQRKGQKMCHVHDGMMIMN